jgi:hypothetical protein
LDTAPAGCVRVFCWSAADLLKRATVSHANMVMARL